MGKTLSGAKPRERGTELPGVVHSGGKKKAETMFWGKCEGKKQSRSEEGEKPGMISIRLQGKGRRELQE